MNEIQQIIYSNIGLKYAIQFDVSLCNIRHSERERKREREKERAREEIQRGRDRETETQRETERDTQRQKPVKKIKKNYIKLNGIQQMTSQVFV